MICNTEHTKIKPEAHKTTLHLWRGTLLESRSIHKWAFRQTCQCSAKKKKKAMPLQYSNRFSSVSNHSLKLCICITQPIEAELVLEKKQGLRGWSGDKRQVLNCLTRSCVFLEALKIYLTICLEAIQIWTGSRTALLLNSKFPTWLMRCLCAFYWWEQTHIISEVTMMWGCVETSNYSKGACTAPTP